MPGKRKASDSVGIDTPAPKLSKKAAREQAMLRAKQSMQADKKKVAAVKAKNQKTPSGRTAVDEDSSDERSSPDIRSAKAKRRRLSERSPDVLSPKQRAREEAIGRAKEYGAEDKNELARKKKASPAPKTAAAAPPPFSPPANGTAAPLQHIATQPPPIGSPPLNPAAMWPPHNYYGNVNNPLMAQYMMSQQQQQPGMAPPHQQPGMDPQYPYMMAQQQPYGGGFGTQFAGSYGAPFAQAQQQPLPPGEGVAPPQQPHSAPPPQPSAPLAARNVAPQAPRSSVAPSPASSRISAVIVDEEEDDDNEDIPPPPPPTTLRAQTSQQLATYRLPQQREEPLGIAVSQQFEEFEEETEEPSKKKRTYWGKGLLGAILVGIVSFVVMQDSGTESAIAAAADRTGQPPCFFDSFAVYDEEDHVIPACTQENGEPCVVGGVCEKGVLVSCTNGHYQVSGNRGACVLSESTKETMTAWRSLLEEKSVDAQCGLILSDSMPMFLYSELVLDHADELATNTLELPILETEFVTEHRVDGLYLGLSKDCTSLRFPIWCRVAKSIKGGLGFCGSLCIVVLHFLASLGMSSFRAYPLMSIVGLLVVYIIKRFRDYKAYRSKLLRDVAKAREMACDILQDSSDRSHVVLHVRDEVANTVYPESRKERQYLIKNVWPRVVPCFTEDNRIRKATKLMDGKPRDMWQWISVASAKKKRVTMADQ